MNNATTRFPFTIIALGLFLAKGALACSSDSGTKEQADAAQSFDAGDDRCGNGSCEPGESMASCPADCSSESEMCSDTCPFALDMECDDGGEGATTSACALGTDCADCGPRTGECTPQCANRVCGDDGCGGTCGPGCISEDICTAEGQCDGEGSGTLIAVNRSGGRAFYNVTRFECGSRIGTRMLNENAKSRVEPGDSVTLTVPVGTCFDIRASWEVNPNVLISDTAENITFVAGTPRTLEFFEP